MTSTVLLLFTSSVTSVTQRLLFSFSSTVTSGDLAVNVDIVFEFTSVSSFEHSVKILSSFETVSMIWPGNMVSFKAVITEPDPIHVLDSAENSDVSFLPSAIDIEPVSPTAFLAISPTDY